MEPLAVDIRLVESFAVLAEELHFTRAAERLGVAQPALSQQIARLERQLGARLFSRAPGAVTLTPSGAALWAEARPAMVGLRAGVAAARAVAHGMAGRLRVRHLSSYGPVVLPAIAAAVRDVAPDLFLELREASIEEQLQEIRLRSADLGLFHLDPTVAVDATGLTLVPLATTVRYVVLPRDHALAERTSISFSELREEPWVMPVGASDDSLQAASFLASCHRHGFEPDVVQRANSIETMLGLVSSGFGVAPAPWPVALRPPPDLALVPVVGDHHHVFLARVSDDSNPACALFIEEARQVVLALSEEREDGATG